MLQGCVQFAGTNLEEQVWLKAVVANLVKAVGPLRLFILLLLKLYGHPFRRLRSICRDKLYKKKFRWSL